MPPPPPVRKRPAVSAPAGSEQLWTRRLLIFLSTLAVISAAVIFHFENAAPAVTEAYFPVRIKTTVGANRVMVGQLNLLIAPDQEEGLRRRQQQLEAVVGQALADSYAGKLRPALAEVRQNLYDAINDKLPRKLQVRDVLIHEMLLGTD